MGNGIHTALLPHPVYIPQGHETNLATRMVGRWHCWDQSRIMQCEGWLEAVDADRLRFSVHLNGVVLGLALDDNEWAIVGWL